MIEQLCLEIHVAAIRGFKTICTLYLRNTIAIAAKMFCN